LPNLDFMRSVAVLSVVVEHTLISLGILKIGPFPYPVSWRHGRDGLLCSYGSGFDVVAGEKT
jgi:peptidoglycan/LPS O-acetylase OafA/YrhL